LFASKPSRDDLAPKAILPLYHYRSCFIVFGFGAGELGALFDGMDIAVLHGNAAKAGRKIEHLLFEWHTELSEGDLEFGSDFVDIRALHEEGELISALTKCLDVPDFCDALQFFRENAKRCIAGFVAVVVVDILESIEIAEKK
jgi:hypothetical protein